MHPVKEGNNARSINVPSMCVFFTIFGILCCPQLVTTLECSQSKYLNSRLYSYSLKKIISCWGLNSDGVLLSITSFFPAECFGILPGFYDLFFFRFLVFLFILNIKAIRNPVAAPMANVIKSFLFSLIVEISIPLSSK